MQQNLILPNIQPKQQMHLPSQYRSPGIKFPIIQKPPNIVYLKKKNKQDNKQMQIYSPSNHLHKQTKKNTVQIQGNNQSFKYENKWKKQMELYMRKEDYDKNSLDAKENQQSSQNKSQKKKSSYLGQNKGSVKNIKTKRVVTDKSKQLKNSHIQKNLNLDDIRNKIAYLQKNKANITKQRHLSLNSGKKLLSPQRGPPRQSLQNHGSQKLEDIHVQFKINSNSDIANIEDQILFSNEYKNRIADSAGDKTMEDFQKSVEKNRQYIHGEISKNMNQKRIIQNIPGNRNKTQSSYLNNWETNIVRGNLLQKNINKIKSYKKYTASDEQHSRFIVPPRKNDKKLRHNSGEIKNSEMKRVQSHRKEKKKIQSQNKLVEPPVQESFLSQSSIFADINKIILDKLSKNDPSQAHSVAISPISNIQSKKLKQQNKLQKLIRKIKSFSPEKSHLQIQKQIAIELHNEFGIKHQILEKSGIACQEKELKYKLKDENNFSDWRRVNLDFVSDKEKRYLNGNSLNLQQKIIEDNRDILNKSIEYVKTNYENQNSRLKNYVLKTENSLADYFNARSQLQIYQQTKQIKLPQ